MKTSRKKILVTGGTGFVGSNLASKLTEDGHEVIITGHTDEQKPPQNATVVYADVASIDWTEIGRIDALFHEGAITDTSIYDRDKMLKANVDDAKTFFEKSIEHGAKNIVYASSTAVYGNLPAPYREDGPVDPLNPYAESKVLLDEFARAFSKEHPDIRVVGLRYCNVYGPGESHKGKMASMVHRLAQQMARGNPKLFKYGEQKREYIYVKDVVSANLLALEARENCVVNCAPGRARTFNELVAILNGVMGSNRTPEYIDNPYADKYQSHIECDVSLAKRLLNFSAAYDLERGVKDYFESGTLIQQ